jgi:hypothetical protein
VSICLGAVWLLGKLWLKKGKKKKKKIACVLILFGILKCIPRQVMGFAELTSFSAELSPREFVFFSFLS